MCIRDRREVLHEFKEVFFDEAYAAGLPLDVPPGSTLIDICLLYTSDAADERSSVDLGGRRIIKKKNKEQRDKGTIVRA